MKQILKISLIVISAFIGLYFLFIYLYTHGGSGDYGHIKVEHKMNVGITYHLKQSKDEIFSKLIARNINSKSENNLRDSSFIIYYPSDSKSVDIEALVRIIGDENKTIIKFDSIIGYIYLTKIKRSEAEEMVNRYDSIYYRNQFEKEVLNTLTDNSRKANRVFFDNKRILDVDEY